MEKGQKYRDMLVIADRGRHYCRHDDGEDIITITQVCDVRDVLAKNGVLIDSLDKPFGAFRQSDILRILLEFPVANNRLETKAGFERKCKVTHMPSKNGTCAYARSISMFAFKMPKGDIFGT